MRDQIRSIGAGEVEVLPSKQMVGGSNPSRGTNRDFSWLAAVWQIDRRLRAVSMNT